MPASAGLALRAAVLALLAWRVGFDLLPALGTIDSDFANYLVPARAVLDGESLDDAYTRHFMAPRASALGLDLRSSLLPQPPANALLLLPLAGLPPATAKALWTLLLAASMGLAFALLRPLLARPWLGALAFLLPSAATHNALLYGQPYPLLLLLLCLSLRALERGRALRSGAWLAPVLALKLYGLPFLAWSVLQRRFRLAAALCAGTLLLSGLSVVLLGLPVHLTWLREVLPASLAGRIQDPYSPTWNSLASLAWRLFQREPDLNPQPLADLPRLAAALARALPVMVTAAAVLAARRAAVRRAYAILTVGGLLASPLTSTYHFVLLALPGALLLDDAGPRRGAVLAALLALAGSAASHHVAFLADGATAPLAYPRAGALLGLFALAIRGVARPRDLGPVLLAGGLAAAPAPAAPDEEPWTRVAEARGYLAAEPSACADGISWLAVRAGGFVRQGPCPGPRTPARSDDGRLEVASEWHGSWDLVVREVGTGRAWRISHDPANELEPAFLPAGRGVVFASDRRRGLGSTALHVVPLPAGLAGYTPRP